MTFVVGSIIAAITLLAGAFLLARDDSVREGVGTLDQRSRLRAWNKSFLSMLGLAGRDLRPGASLPLKEADTNEFGQRVREVGTAA
jgi:hypothetical protein